MGAYEIINVLFEQRHRSGWQDPDIIELPNNLGKIIIGMRIDENNNVVEVKHLYYSFRDDKKMNDEVTVGIIIKNDLIYEFEVHFNETGKIIGHYDSDIQKIRDYFLEKIAAYLNDLKETKMDNKKIMTARDLIQMMPGIDKKIDKALMQYGKKYSPAVREDKKIASVSDIKVKKS